MEGVDLTCLVPLFYPTPATMTYSSPCFWLSEVGLHSHGWLSERTSTMGVEHRLGGARSPSDIWALRLVSLV